MRALVVVESVFGNTRRIAEAITSGLSVQADVRIVDVAEAPMWLEGTDLVVVGGPTHAFGMTRPSTRQGAARQTGGRVTAAEIGLREWLSALPTGTGDAAVFDTRVIRPRRPGASRGAARRLKRKGYRLITRPATFRVKDRRAHSATASSTAPGPGAQPSPPSSPDRGRRAGREGGIRHQETVMWRPTW
jgi:hypothetical protein